MEDIKLEKNAEEVAWEKERNITIELAKMSELDEIRAFESANFYPDEPATRCLGLWTGTGFIDKQIQKLVIDITEVVPVKQNAKLPACLVARSNETGEIVGTRFGEIRERSESLSMGDPNFRWLGNLPKFIPVPRIIVKVANFQYLMDKIPYSYKDAFKELDGQFIYCCHHVCVGRKARRKGLGMELIKRGHKLAERAGCRQTYVMATSIYSQKIFSKLGYKILHEVQYSDHEKDRRGRPFLDNVGEHVSIQILSHEHPEQKSS